MTVNAEEKTFDIDWKRVKTIADELKQWIVEKGYTYTDIDRAIAELRVRDDPECILPSIIDRYPDGTYTTQNISKDALKILERSRQSEEKTT